MLNVAARSVPRRIRTHIFYKLIGLDKEFRVLSGNFAGMRYVAESVGSQLYPKLLGTYEAELAPIVKALTEKRFDTIVDVGAAEGYYAVGLAILNCRARVVAFEAASEGMQLIREMALANGVLDRITIKGFCTPQALAASVNNGANCLIVMDVEGYEDELIDLATCPGVAKAHLLIELHDFVSEELGDRIAERLAGTHRIAEIREQRRTMNDFPIAISALRRLAFKKLYLRSMNEHRGNRMRWFYCEPHRE
jgi:hypothetical protein